MNSLKRTRLAAAKILRMLEERSDPVPAWKLAMAAGLEGDRTCRDTRRAVAHLAAQGYPVAHVHGQGYRLARTPADVRAYVEKLDQMIEALETRVRQACRYEKLYMGQGYLGKVHGPRGGALEALATEVEA